jgi:hypothetical protein
MTTMLIDDVVVDADRQTEDGGLMDAALKLH